MEENINIILQPPILYMGVNPKIGVDFFYPQNGWCIINGKHPMNKWDDFRGNFPLFLVQHPGEGTPKLIFFILPPHLTPTTFFPRICFFVFLFVKNGFLLNFYLPLLVGGRVDPRANVDFHEEIHHIDIVTGAPRINCAWRNIDV